LLLTRNDSLVSNHSHQAECDHNCLNDYDGDDCMNPEIEADSFKNAHFNFSFDEDAEIMPTNMEGAILEQNS